MGFFMRLSPFLADALFCERRGNRIALTEPLQATPQLYFGIRRCRKRSPEHAGGLS
jgi:hypothetical protein